ncbi:MAG: OmpA family protein [Rhodobacteraceae bacterium]|nr:OmpA family protein [Paracoccaceae bacterium]
MKRLILALALLAPAAEAAPTLNLPPASVRTAGTTETRATYALPTGAWKGGALATLRTEGEVSRTAWRIEEGDVSTPVVFAELRDQLTAEGFTPLFECDTDGCGGFDFRFAIDVIPEPDMHIDLGDFRFLSAGRGTGDTAEYVSLLVSRSAESAYVQLTRVGPELAFELPLARAEQVAAPVTGGLGDTLMVRGKVVLDDLSFKSGSTDLVPGDYPSLDDLASYLKANPDKTVALVGHTDAEGSLASNVAVSRKRAEAVRAYLVRDLGCNPAQLSADGVGYLSPLASNMTDEGRTKNRRVEALLTSTR